MTVFIAHAPSDRPAAEELERLLERRGWFSELDDGETALAPVAERDVVIQLISAALTEAPGRMRLEQRALDAWSEGRLVLVRLDEAPAPVGLRDLPAIAGDERWAQVVEEVAALQSEPEAAPPPPPARRGGALRTLLTLALAVPGAIAIAAVFAMWLTNRIGPTPGGWGELRADIDAFGVRYGAPQGVMEWLFAVSIPLTALLLLLLLVRAVRPRQQPEGTSGIYVAYAAEDAEAVAPLVAAPVFRAEPHADAEEAARDIGGADAVLIMCSPAAFASDRVKRELFLADRLGKPIAPVLLADAEPPEDFRYFLSSIAPVKLFETPEAERPEALARAIGAA
ncbi:MAG: toll/interleukin-1 receptor domain-containing protein [Hyphomonadaceae bacterium]|nr:toll/interleukin-1 receptor domain-containing protein [Hyphomonadaceae bacterium]